MNFLHRNKKVVNAGAFTESAYEVLNYEQLLKVNGAGGGSGGSGGGGPSGPSSSSGSSSSSSGYGSCGGGSSSSGYSSCGGGNNSTNSGYSSCGGGSNSGGKIVENSNSGVANANVGDIIIRTDGTVVTLTQADITWAQEQVNKENAATSSPSTTTNTETTTASTTTTSEETTTSSRETNSSSVPNNNTGGNSSSENNNSSVIQKIKDSIKENYNKKYNEKGNGYKCDNWVEEVLNDAGYSAKDYLTAGNSTKKVSEHIAALKESGNEYTTTIPTKEGYYVVFMDGEGSLGNLDPHCGILEVSSNGSMSFIHNSSANDNNGVDTWSVTAQNNNTKLSNLAYKNFYFQEIK